MPTFHVEHRPPCNALLWLEVGLCLSLGFAAGALTVLAILL